jgi:cytochrome P450
MGTSTLVSTETFTKLRAACIGKAIAMQELRIVTATVVMTFDLELSSTFDSKKFDENVTDRFLTEINEPLNMILTMRKDVDHHLADVEL